MTKQLICLIVLSAVLAGCCRCPKPITIAPPQYQEPTQYDYEFVKEKDIKVKEIEQ